jgi:hypothetical protein
MLTYIKHGNGQIIGKDSLQRIKDKIQNGSDRQNKILPFCKPGTNGNLLGGVD